MTIGFIFWLILLITLLFGGWSFRTQTGSYQIWGPPLLIWVLLFLLGVGVFGWPIKG